MQQGSISIKWALYALVIGISLSASVYMISEPLIHFSIFPFLSLFFAVNHFYRIYTKQSQNEKVITTSWASFFIGIFFYSALVGAMYPELGSNFISVTLTLFICIWLIYKFIFGEKPYTL